MQLTTTLAAMAALITTASAGQVNFYSDTNCQNYIGERHPAAFATTGSVTSSPPLLTLAPPIVLVSPSSPHTNGPQRSSRLLLCALGLYRPASVQPHVRTDDYLWRRELQSPQGDGDWQV